MAKLEVRGECQGLGHGDVSPSLEHHHGDGAAGESITNDKLSDDVEANLLVGNSLDHADRDDIDESFGKVSICDRVTGWRCLQITKARMKY